MRADASADEVKVRRLIAGDGCGNIINPIVDGQIHGGLTMDLASALFKEINYNAIERP